MSLDAWLNPKKKRKVFGNGEPLKFMTWNANSLFLRGKREPSLLKAFVEKHDPDLICFQETRITPDLERELEIILKKKAGLESYSFVWSSHKKKKYSGTCICFKTSHGPIGKPKKELIHNNEGKYPKSVENPETEGRIISLEYRNFWVVNTYTPNGSWHEPGRKRRLAWDKRIISHILKLQETKPVLWFGDLNVCHKEIDVTDPAYFSTAKNRKKKDSLVGQPGFSKEERASFDNVLKRLDLIDSFRELNPEKRKFTWGFQTGNGKYSDKGMRLDYCLVDRTLEKRMAKSIIGDIKKEKLGSDHGVAMLVLNPRNQKKMKSPKETSDFNSSPLPP